MLDSPAVVPVIPLLWKVVSDLFSMYNIKDCVVPRIARFFMHI